MILGLDISVTVRLRPHKKLSAATWQPQEVNDFNNIWEGKKEKEKKKIILDIKLFSTETTSETAGYC